MIYLNDIMTENGKFISFETLTYRFGQHLTSYDFICIKHAIPQKWKRILLREPLLRLFPEDESVFYRIGKTWKPAQLIKSKNIYWYLNKQNDPSCLQAWFEKYFIEFTEKQWKIIFCLAKSLTFSTKLIEFQFKIIHRVYSSDSYVSNFDNTVSKICSKCKVDNNIPHLFVDCVRVEKFWNEFRTWFRELEEADFILTTRDIIFGFPSIMRRGLNFCLLHAKWYIHLHKQDEGLIIFNAFKRYLSAVFIIERQIATSKNVENVFNKTFNVIIANLF